MRRLFIERFRMPFDADGHACRRCRFTAARHHAASIRLRRRVRKMALFNIVAASMLPHDRRASSGALRTDGDAHLMASAAALPAAGCITRQVVVRRCPAEDQPGFWK